jgi:hypothetical protein
MRSITFALTALTAVSILALTAVAGGGLVGSTDTTQNPQIHSGGVAGPAESGFLRRSFDRLAKGDMTGTGGGGKGAGMMGDMMGSMGKKGGDEKKK